MMRRFRACGPVLVAVTMLVALTGCVSVGTPGSAAPSVSVPPSTPALAAPVPAPPTSAPTPPADVAVPADLLLPDEGDTSDTAEFTDWATDGTLGRPWLLDPCRPTTYPTDARRTSFRTVSRTGPETGDARQLAVYPTAEVASEAMAGFRRALAACSTGGHPAEGSAWEWVTADVPDLGADGFLAASTTGGPGFSPTGDRIAVTRAGSAVFLAYGSGESSIAELDGGADAAQEVAQRFLDSL